MTRKSCYFRPKQTIESTQLDIVKVTFGKCERLVSRQRHEVRALSPFPLAYLNKAVTGYRALFTRPLTLKKKRTNKLLSLPIGLDRTLIDQLLKRGLNLTAIYHLKSDKKFTKVSIQSSFFDSCLIHWLIDSLID